VQSSVRNCVSIVETLDDAVEVLLEVDVELEVAEETDVMAHPVAKAERRAIRRILILLRARRLYLALDLPPHYPSAYRDWPAKKAAR